MRELLCQANSICHVINDNENQINQINQWVGWLVEVGVKVCYKTGTSFNTQILLTFKVLNFLNVNIHYKT